LHVVAIALACAALHAGSHRFLCTLQKDSFAGAGAVVVAVAVASAVVVADAVAASPPSDPPLHGSADATKAMTTAARIVSCPPSEGSRR
jgi:hypothetical protein